MTTRDAVYTHGHHEAVMRSHRWRTAENSAGYLLPELHPGLSLLDVGCGGGTITVGLAERVAPGRVTALEPADATMDEARGHAAERGVDVEFRTGTVYALDIPDDTCDVVHAHQVLQHLGDPVGALREMRRVCRPGGVVAARDADYAAMTWYPEIPALADWLSVYRRTARANGGEPDAARYLRSWALRAGFTDVRCSASAWCYTEPEDRTRWAETWAERTLSGNFSERAQAAGVATPADLRRIADGWAEWAAAEDAWFGVLHGEILCRH